MKRDTNGVRIVVFALLVAIAAGAWAQEERGPDTQRLAGRADIRGAWKVNHIPGDGGPPPFWMLMVFTRDGAVVQTDAGPPHPLLFSPGIGEWKKTGDGHYVAKYTQLEFDAAGTHIDNFDALLDVTLDESGNAFSGTVRVRFIGLDGVLLFEAYGRVEGTRLTLD